MLRACSLALALAVSAAAGGGCVTASGPTVRVLGVDAAAWHDVVFVQVTNSARKPLRLTRLEYTFASAGGTVARGELPLRRDVPAGAAVVVEVPLGHAADRADPGALTLRGKLTAELGQVVRIFTVAADVGARASE